MGLVNIKSLLRAYFGRSPFLVNFYRINHNKLVVTDKTFICLESYPRCGNTYLFYLVDDLYSQKRRIAHHLHMSGQLKRAISRSIPAVVVLRKPEEAVASFVLRERGVSLKTALLWYYIFHKDVYKLRKKLYLFSFKELTRDYKFVIQKIVEIYPELNLNITDLDLSRIELLMSENDQKYKPKNITLGSTKPNSEKDFHKRKLISQLNHQEDLKKLLSKCNNLYNRLDESKVL